MTRWTRSPIYQIVAHLQSAGLVSLCCRALCCPAVADNATICGATSGRENAAASAEAVVVVVASDSDEKVHTHALRHSHPSGTAHDDHEWIWERWKARLSAHINADDLHTNPPSHRNANGWLPAFVTPDASNSRPAATHRTKFLPAASGLCYFNLFFLGKYPTIKELDIIILIKSLLLRHIVFSISS